MAQLLPPTLARHPAIVSILVSSPTGMTSCEDIRHQKNLNGGWYVAAEPETKRILGNDPMSCAGA